MERETARNIVRRLQMEAGDAITIEPYFWEHEAMSATRDYQQNIPEMSSFDVVVCMLWSRLGTPLHPERHPRPDGGFFESGTEYEFYTAMSAFKEKGTPNIFVFRNHTEPRRPSRPREAREAADRELDRLDHFFERYFQEGNFFTAAVNEYRTLGEFEDKLSLGLRSYLLEHVADAEARSEAGGPIRGPAVSRSFRLRFRGRAGVLRPHGAGRRGDRGAAGAGNGGGRKHGCGAAFRVVVRCQRQRQVLAGAGRSAADAGAPRSDRRRAGLAALHLQTRRCGGRSAAFAGGGVDWRIGVAGTRRGWDQRGGTRVDDPPATCRIRPARAPGAQPGRRRREGAHGDGNA